MKTLALAPKAILPAGYANYGDDGLAEAQIAAAIYSLSDRERLVVALQYLEGFRVREIAAIMELSASRVYQLRSQALQKVRGEVGGTAALAA